MLKRYGKKALEESAIRATSSRPPARTRRTCTGSAALVTTATVPLALGLVGDVYVVITKIVATPTAGLIAGSLALVPAVAEFAVGINNASVSTLNLTVQVVDAALEPLPRRFKPPLPPLVFGRRRQ